MISHQDSGSYAVDKVSVPFRGSAEGGVKVQRLASSITSRVPSS